MGQASCLPKLGGGLEARPTPRLDVALFQRQYTSDAKGVLYFYSVSSVNTCELFISDDGAMAWGSPIPALGGDKPWITVDTTPSAGSGNIYATWSHWLRQFGRSRDGGATFEAFTDEFPYACTISVGTQGEVYVAGHDDLRVVFFRSLDAREQEPDVTFDIIQVLDLGGEARAGAPVNRHGLIDQTWVATDHSGGPADGAVYVLRCVDPPGDDPLDTRFTASFDRGISWTPSVRLNDDAEGTNAWQWFGTMSVALNGRIDVVWYDTRNDPNPATPATSQVYYTFSQDAGQTWATNQALSPPFEQAVGYPTLSQKLGDYIHMVSDDVGANLAFAATFNGEQDIYFLRIGPYDCNANGVPDEDDLDSGLSTDLDGNGIPDECDCLGDADHDFDVDVADLSEMLERFGRCVGDEGFRADLDLNGSGCLDLEDLSVQLARLGEYCP